LDSLGFPWILSSESRLFNGLRGLKLVFFSCGLSVAHIPGTAGDGGAEEQDYSWGELNLISVFLQEIFV
jgi:hypothetical protein